MVLVDGLPVCGMAAGYFPRSYLRLSTIRCTQAREMSVGGQGTTLERAATIVGFMLCG